METGTNTVSGVEVEGPRNRPRALTAQDRELFERLHERLPALRERWNAASPFHYVIIDDFLPSAAARAIYDVYPTPDIEGWDQVTYTHQKKKFSMRSGFPKPIDDFFQLSATSEFVAWLGELTGVRDLIHDPELVGGGLHSILRGGFLDVHVDYNFHPRSKLHRRLNLLLYMNKDWQPEYQGHLQLWDVANKRQIENIAPLYNRVVVFETNEVSFHGHPNPLMVPQNRTRNSLALYYYTKERDEIAPEHNTLYKQTTGLRGRAKTLLSSIQAVGERTREQGVRALFANLSRKIRRRIAGLPPENK